MIPPLANGDLWNAGALVGAKRPLKPRDVWAIRFFLDEQMAGVYRIDYFVAGVVSVAGLQSGI